MPSVVLANRPVWRRNSELRTSLSITGQCTHRALASSPQAKLLLINAEIVSEERSGADAARAGVVAPAGSAAGMTKSRIGRAECRAAILVAIHEESLLFPSTSTNSHPRPAGAARARTRGCCMQCACNYSSLCHTGFPGVRTASKSGSRTGIAVGTSVNISLKFCWQENKYHPLGGGYLTKIQTKQPGTILLS